MTEKETFKVLATGLAFPEGPVLLPDGRTLCCVNVEAGFLSRLDLETLSLTRQWLTLPDEGRGNGATWGPDGLLYVADVGARRIVCINTTDHSVRAIVDKDADGDPLRGPNDLIFGPDGSLYFTDPQGSWNEPVGSVYQVTPFGKIRHLAGGLRFPNGLCLSPDARVLFLAQSPLGRVDALHLETGILTPFAQVGTAGGPDGLRLSREGFLYAAVFGEGVIAKVNPQGEVVQRLPAGGQNPTNLCFSPDDRLLYVTEAQTHRIVVLSLVD